MDVEYTSLSDFNRCSEAVAYAFVEEDGTGPHIMEIFDDLHEVCVDVVLLHGCPQCRMPISVECLLEVYGDMVDVFLMLEIFLT